jgi:hypothetical protein
MGGQVMQPLRIFTRILGLFPFLLGFSGMSQEALAHREKIPEPAIEQVSSLLGKPDVVILDLRTGKVDRKIPGSVREDPNRSVNSWAEKFPKEKTFILYCD